ncbi:hypothetical protein AB0D14_06265 [Streptomyces sp. NPDC048484]
MTALLTSVIGDEIRFGGSGGSGGISGIKGTVGSIPVAPAP